MNALCLIFLYRLRSCFEIQERKKHHFVSHDGVLHNSHTEIKCRSLPGTRIDTTQI